MQNPDNIPIFVEPRYLWISNNGYQDFRLELKTEKSVIELKSHYKKSNNH